MKRVLLLALAFASAHAAEVIEVAPGNEAVLPGGKEADGIIGDFLLRSDKVEAVVSQNAPNRRANMSTFYGDDGVTPGCLFDLTLKGTNNDQLICFGPCGHGPVSYVRTTGGKKGGGNFSASVEAVTTAAKNGGIFKLNFYKVEDGIQGIFITTVMRNESDKPQQVSTKNDFTRFEKTGTLEGGITYANAVDPADKAGYAFVTLKLTGLEKEGGNVTLAPGNELIIERFMAVGRSPAEAVGWCQVQMVPNERPGQPYLSAQQEQKSKFGTLQGTLLDEAGKPVTSGAVMIPFGKTSLPAYPDAKGVFEVMLKPGKLTVLAEDLGRSSVPYEFEMIAGKTTKLEARLSAASRIRFDITDASGKSTPCKAMFKPLTEGVKLDLGPKMRAHGCVDQYHSEKGQFTVQVPTGKYLVRVVRGGEFSSIEKEVDVAQGAEVVVKGQLKRVVDSTGWVTSDFHNHSTQSGDNICGTDDRLINIAAENLEWCPTTEHNRLYDWLPHMQRLGLTEYFATVPGMELTGSRQHFNSFPLTPKPRTQDNGAPVWNDDPRITAITLRRWQGEIANRWIQFNHPDLSNMFIDRDSNGVADGGFVGVGGMIDGSETQNGNETNILADAPFIISRKPGTIAAKANPVREFVWRQLLNQGLRVTALGVADAHMVYDNGVAGWHIYLKSPTDTPKELNWDLLAPHAKAGHVIVTNGPFLEVTTPDGKTAGDDVRSDGGTTLHVKVQGTDWIDIDRIQVLVNSRPDPKLNFTRATHPQMFKTGAVKFDQKIEVPLQADAHLIVVAMGEGSTLEGGYGTSAQAKMKPCAYNNPIYVDADGHGFKPHGDTLGYELPVGGMSADKAKLLLDKDAPKPTPAKK